MKHSEDTNLPLDKFCFEYKELWGTHSDEEAIDGV